MPDSTRKRDISPADPHAGADRAALERLARLQGIVRSIDTMSRGVFSSVSWRAGQWAARQMRRLGLRVPISTAETEMQRLIGELKEIAELPDLDKVPVPDDLVVGRHFRLSTTRPRRFPVTPPGRPADWNLAAGTLNQLKMQIDGWHWRPVISIVVPVHDTRPEWLSELVDSVEAQFYPHRELVLVDDGSTSRATRRALAELGDRERVRVETRAESGGISVATNHGIAVAGGDYVAFVDHDDLLEPDALLQVARAIELTGADIVYTDEDKIDEAGRETYDPHYKSAWSPDMLLAQNYISHLSVIRRAIIDKAGGLNSDFDGSQDHDLLLRCVEHADEVVHVPMVLYHWRAVEGSTARAFSAKAEPWEAGRRAVAEALERRRIAGEARLGDRPGTYRVAREVSGKPVVSIVIPFRDKPELLEQCISSILRKTDYEHFEIVGLDNQSEKESTHALMKRLTGSDQRVRFERYDQPFNFSAINNFGSKLAEGEHLLLLNNDTEIISPGWLGAMLAHSQRDEVGAVGAKLIYPDGRIQHAGVVMGIGGVAGHSHKYIAGTDNGYFSRPHITQNISAVTGACLMIKRELYLAMGGLEEDALSVAFNDIDLCIRLRARGLLNVYEPSATLYHHESVSRGFEDTEVKQQRFSLEAGYMRDRHGVALIETDPYFNPNLALHSEAFVPRR